MTLEQKQQKLLLYYFGEEGAPTDREVNLWLSEQACLADFFDSLNELENVPASELGFTKMALDRIASEGQGTQWRRAVSWVALAAVATISILLLQSKESSDPADIVLETREEYAATSLKAVLNLSGSARYQRISQVTRKNKPSSQPRRYLGRLSALEPKKY